jgi:hypothetical protein
MVGQGATQVIVHIVIGMVIGALIVIAVIFLWPEAGKPVLGLVR